MAYLVSITQLFCGSLLLILCLESPALSTPVREDNLKEEFELMKDYWQKKNCVFPGTNTYSYSSAYPKDVLGLSQQPKAMDLIPCSSDSQISTDVNFNLLLCNSFFKVSKLLCGQNVTDESRQFLAPSVLDQLVKSPTWKVCEAALQFPQILSFFFPNPEFCSSRCVADKKLAPVCNLLVAAILKYEESISSRAVAKNDSSTKSEAKSVPQNQSSTASEDVKIKTEIAQTKVNKTYNSLNGSLKYDQNDKNEAQDKSGLENTTKQDSKLPVFGNQPQSAGGENVKTQNTSPNEKDYQNPNGMASAGKAGLVSVKTGGLVLTSDASQNVSQPVDASKAVQTITNNQNAGSQETGGAVPPPGNGSQYVYRLKTPVPEENDNIKFGSSETFEHSQNIKAPVIADTGSPIALDAQGYKVPMNTGLQSGQHTEMPNSKNVVQQDGNSFRTPEDQSEEPLSQNDQGIDAPAKMNGSSLNQVNRNGTNYLPSQNGLNLEGQDSNVGDNAVLKNHPSTSLQSPDLVNGAKPQEVVSEGPGHTSITATTTDAFGPVDKEKDNYEQTVGEIEAGAIAKKKVRPPQNQNLQTQEVGIPADGVQVVNNAEIGDEETPSGHFMAYFITAVVLCVAGYIIYHNKQKIFAIVLEGRRESQRRRSPSGSNGGSSAKYSKLQSSVEEVVPALEKSTTSKNYIY